MGEGTQPTHTLTSYYRPEHVEGTRIVDLWPSNRMSPTSLRPLTSGYVPQASPVGFCLLTLPPVLLQSEPQGPVTEEGPGQDVQAPQIIYARTSGIRTAQKETVSEGQDGNH